MSRVEQIQEEFEKLLFRILTEGELVTVTDKATGESTSVRAEPSAATLGVIRAYLKDTPAPAKPVQPGAMSGVLKKFAKDLPFTAQA
jgi:DNA-binding protein YbaB